MGPHRGDAGRVLTDRIVQVVPEVAAFAVDDGFAYRVPDDMSVEVGAIVRVPLGGRTVRGYVTDVRTGDGDRLKTVKTRSGDLPVFDAKLLETLRWAAIHYVAPLAAILAKAAPPNLPRRRKPASYPPIDVAEPSPLPSVSDAGAAGRHHRSVFLSARAPWTATIGAIAAPVLANGRSVMVLAPTLLEAGQLYADLGGVFGSRAMAATSALSAAEATTTWVRGATTGGSLLIGTREMALWPISDLGLVIVVDEARRGFKDKATPTVHARDLIRRRSAVERFPAVFTGSVPSLELIHAGLEITPVRHRPWSLVEVVDRNVEPPGGSVLGQSAAAAIKAVAGRGGDVLVFTHRRVYAAAFRCVRCGELRRCAQCGSGPDEGDTCRRCGSQVGPCSNCGGARFQPLGAGAGRIAEELNRRFGSRRAGAPGEGTPIVVATERDLIRLDEFDLAVVVDADSLLLRPTYRSEEDALRLLVRVAQQVGRGRGRRTMVQTSFPEHPVIEALRRGDTSAFLGDALEHRARDGFPPAAELLVIETSTPAEGIDAELRAALDPGVAVLGPAPAGDRSRWLVTGPELRSTRIRLRPLVQRWRDGGVTVRVDADPLDL